MTMSASAPTANKSDILVPPLGIKASGGSCSYQVSQSVYKNFDNKELAKQPLQQSFSLTGPLSDPRVTRQVGTNLVNL